MSGVLSNQGVESILSAPQKRSFRSFKHVFEFPLIQNLTLKHMIVNAINNTCVPAEHNKQMHEKNGERKKYCYPYSGQIDLILIVKCNSIAPGATFFG